MLTPIRVLWVVLAGLLLGLASMWLDEQAQPVPVVWHAPPPVDPVLPELPALVAANLSPREQLLTRPLFTPDRKPLPPPPPPVAAKPPPPPDPLASLRLLGVIGGEVAGVIAEVDGKVRRVMLSQKVGGWSLSAIDGRKVTFQREDETRDMLLAYAPLGSRPAPEVAAVPSARQGAAPGGAAAPAANDPFGTAQRMQEQLRARQAARAAARERAGLNTVAPQ